MKTKVAFKTIHTIVGGLMLILLLTLLLGTMNAFSMGIHYQPNLIMVYTDYGDSREIYTYDDCKNLISLLKQNKEGDNWVNSELTSYIYDGIGNVLTKLIQDAEGVNIKLFTFTYDCDGNCLSTLEQNWEEEQWVDFILETSTYDGTGKIVTKLIEYPAWGDYELHTYSYDHNGNLLVELIDAGYYQMKYTYTYNGAGKRLTWLIEFCDEGTWYNGDFINYFYDAQGNLINHIAMTWYGEELGWVNMSKAIYTNDANGNLLSRIDQWWMWAGGGYWKNTQKIEYEYLPGLVIGHGFSWDQATMEWITGNAGIELALVDQGEKTIFFDGYAYLAEAYYSSGGSLMAEASPYQTVYFGYSPQACVTVSVSVTGGTTPYTYLWDNGVTTASFEACPTESTYYTVTVTDADGCIAQACTKVCVIDVRCGNNLDKVALCHYPPGNPGNCKTLCINMANVPDHLAHGDLLGACGIDHSCTDLKSALAETIPIESEEDTYIKVYPNPTNQTTIITYSINEPGVVSIRMTNVMGQIVKTVFDGYVPENEIQNIEVNLADWQPGIYLLMLQQANGEIITEKLMLQE